MQGVECRVWGLRVGVKGRGFWFSAKAFSLGVRFVLSLKDTGWPVGPWAVVQRLYYGITGITA